MISFRNGRIEKRPAAVLGAALLALALTACGQTSAGYRKNRTLPAEKVKLKLTGSTASFRAMEGVINSFSKIYPNCSVEYEYVQDYEKSMANRLANSGDVDLFLTNNITADSAFLPYALELGSRSDRLRLTDTYDGLIRNFTIPGNGLYAVPLGGEVRGLYVNRTLLSSLGLTVPSNYGELTECCRRLQEAGYVPLQGNPGNFGQLLMYPYVCSLIANADDSSSVYDRVNRCEPGVSEVFREPLRRLYDLTAKGYYNYKYVETEYGLFKDAKEMSAARDFLNLVPAENGDLRKKDDVGTVAFMPGPMSFKSLLDKTRDDYHSQIDYQFILAPVGDSGGYAYLSPYQGIAVNRNSTHQEWALEFLNYLFSKNISKSFAGAQNIIPNTPDALDIIRSDFRTDEKRVCQLGQVSFDYVFYDVMKKSLTDVSKANNPKYMQQDGTMYGLDFYMDGLEKAIAGNRH